MKADPKLRNAIEMCLPAAARRRIEALTATPSDDFVALAKAAGLDSKTSFRGKKLRTDFGTSDLSGFDFSGADLSDCNLTRARIGDAILGRRIFISYAAEDGSEAANALVEFLTDHGHSTWHDVHELTVGKAFFAKFAKALQTTEFLIALITPAALKSTWVREEWREARRMGPPSFQS